MKYDINQEVTYLRSDNDYVVQSGSGIVKAIFLDSDSRVVVQVKDGDNVYNIHLACLNASDEFRAQYEALEVQVKALSEAGNAEVRATVAKFNADIESLKTALLGSPAVA